MAQAPRRRVIANPGGGKRRMTAKQIRYFGTARQKAALKRHRPRSARAGARAGASGGRKPNRGRKSTGSHARRRPVRKNVGGEILSLIPAMAGNPGKKKRSKKSMPKAKRRRAASHRTRTAHRRRRTTKSNPGRRTHRRRLPNSSTRTVYRYRTRAARRHMRRGRRNPGSSGGIVGLFTNALWAIGGAVGTKIITQAVLGASNTGVMGYIGNAVTAFGLSLVVGKFFKNPAAGHAVLTGGVIAIVLRLISDFTPLGSYTSQIGLGDYQVSNWVTPQRYVDALNSAQVEIPAGWAPTVVQSNAPPAGGGAGMGGLYSGGGLYSVAA